MTQPDLRKLAQQSDPAAIARLLNRVLQPRGVTAKILLNDHCLKILLSSDRPLEQQAFVQFIQRQVNSLNISSITQVKVYSQRLGEGVPAWYQEFTPAYVPNGFIKNGTVPITKPGSLVKYKGDRDPFWTTLQSFQLNSIFPLQDVFSAELYQSPAVRLLLFLGLFPLVVNLLAEQASIEQTAWLIGIYYASIWGVLLHNLIRPAQFSWSNTLFCILVTTCIGIPMLLLFQQVPPFKELYQAVNGGLAARFVGFVLGVGVLEEACKALPLCLLVLFSRKSSDPHTIAFYGAMSGLGFAIAEGAVYSLRYVLGLTQGHLGLGSYMAASTIRFVSLPLFHATLAGIVGYFIGLATINPSRRSAIVLIGMTIAVLLHGGYNTFAGGFPGLLIIGFTILLFITYLRRSKQLVDEMHQAEQEKRKGVRDEG